MNMHVHVALPHKSSSINSLWKVLVHGVVKGLEHVAVLELRVGLVLHQQLQKTDATIASCYHQTSAERERERELNFVIPATYLHSLP